MALEIDRMMDQISHYPGVLGVFLFNLDGICIKSYKIFDEDKIKLYSSLCTKINACGQRVIQDFSNGQLELIRIMSDYREYLIAFERDHIMLTIYKQGDCVSPQ